MITGPEKHGGDTLGYLGIAAAAIISALGWFSLEKFAPPGGENSHFVIAFMRTLFTLLPAAAAFWIAGWRQRRTHKHLSLKLEQLKSSMIQFQRLQRIEHEIHTMDRLAKVAREAVKNTAVSAKELLGAIEGVDDPRTKERLTERYRYHTNNVITVLSAVSEQMEDSGRAIQRELTAEDSVHILEREKSNTSQGVLLAKEIMEQRGITDGLKQLTFASEQATQLQNQLSTLKTLALPES